MKFDKNKIAKKLEEKEAYLPCARCGKQSFSIGEGFGSFSIQDDFGSGNIIIGGKNIPVVYIICNNCGATTPHALGALDMLEPPKPISTPAATPVPTPSSAGGKL